jgi:recombinational DNA repair protein RecR
VKHPVTPDGRYFVVRGRLWRVGNPQLDEAEREELVKRLMAARRAVRDAK